MAMRVRVAGARKPKAAARATGGALQAVGKRLANVGARVRAAAPMATPAPLGGITPPPPGMGAGAAGGGIPGMKGGGKVKGGKKGKK